MKFGTYWVWEWFSRCIQRDFPESFTFRGENEPKTKNKRFTIEMESLNKFQRELAHSQLVVYREQIYKLCQMNLKELQNLLLTKT